MTTESVTLELPATSAQELNAARQELSVDILERRLRELKIERALERYGRAEISFRAAIYQAGISQPELARYACATDLEPAFSDETLAEELW